jgi:hypothetical protein
MSKDAMAAVFADMLEDEKFVATVKAHPEVLGTYDLTQAEKTALLKEAQTPTSGTMGDGPVLSALNGGPQLSPTVASRLGALLNRAAGLPVGALNGPGFLSNQACCAWGHAVIGEFEI